MMAPRQRKANWLQKKQKPAEKTLLEQLGGPLKDFVNDFKEHGRSVLEQVRERNPEKYLELSTKLASLVAMIKPGPSDYAKARTHEEIAIATLKEVGCEDPTPAMIAEATQANKNFVARLEAIRDDAIMAAAVEGELT